MTWSLTVLAAAALGAWLYLILFHGRFWRADQRLDRSGPEPSRWPRVAAVVPARNEADVIGQSIASLLNQDYPGELAAVLIDDGSSDGTVEAAQRAAASVGAEEKLTVVEAPPLAPGWTGKMWAVSQGVARVPDDTDYLLLTDADIVHGSDMLRRLVAKAVAEGLHLVSLMVRLHCRGLAERLLIPAFVFFFQKLYPFPRVNRRDSRLAGAAGGCMLVRRDSLRRAGGIEAIRGALIDDCALARRIKAVGPIWLGLAEESRSIRPYDGLGGIWRMVARTAYTQLGHSPLNLMGTVLGMTVLYVVPPAVLIAALVAGVWPAVTMAGAAYALMMFAYLPTVRLYPGAAAFVPLLPLAALLYTAMTVDSARRHHRGAGGGWKGRTYHRGQAHPDASP